MTTAGVPLGLAAVKFWTRDSFKGTATLKCHFNPTHVPIEKTKESVRRLENSRQSVALLKDLQRCIHVGDRESDIYEIFCLAKDLNTRFPVRAQTDRLAAQTVTSDDEPRLGRARLAQFPSAGHMRSMLREKTAARLGCRSSSRPSRRYPTSASKSDTHRRH